LKGAAASIAILLVAGPGLAGPIPAGERKSGYEFMTPETRAQQDDEATGPTAFALLEGEAAWSRREGASGKACADCHGDVREKMKGVAARYPKFDAKAGKPLTLEQRIVQCRRDNQQAGDLAPESRELLALGAHVGRASRGLAISPDPDPRSNAHRDRGRATFDRRMGQLNLSCAQCHDDNWGKSLAGSRIPQGHPTGYPIYRLEWQAMGSLTRRIRGCLTGIRALPYAWGSAEMVDLEMYLMQRAAGMKVETPAVRP
jgi:sulfur-oxidizing protein SoxA